MLAPTPVSALVHSSTLVTAGVYLLFRFYPLGSSLILHVGIFTTLLAGWSAFYECDTKKIVALSTLSQLGLIVSALGLGVRSFCFAHLNIHASFKALLFISAGCMIHSVYGTQEVRSSVPFWSCQPLLTFIILFSIASMCGLVCLSGFFSKEAILVALYNSSSGYISALLFYIGIGLTIGYSLRFMLLVVCAQTFCVPLSTSTALPSLATLPLCWLLLCSLVQGSSIIHVFSASFRGLALVDVLFLFVLILISFLMSFLGARSRREPIFMPLLALGSIFSVTSFLLMRPGTNIHSSQLHIHGFGVSILHSFFKPFSGAQHITAKAFLLLSLVFYLS